MILKFSTNKPNQQLATARSTQEEEKVTSSTETATQILFPLSAMPSTSKTLRNSQFWSLQTTEDRFIASSLRQFNDYEDYLQKNEYIRSGSVAEAMIERSANISRMLSNGGTRNTKSSSVHRFEDFLIRAFLFPFDLAGRILHIGRERRKEAIESFAICVCVSPSTILLEDIELSFFEIAGSFDLVVVEEIFIAVESIKSKFIGTEGNFAFFRTLTLLPFPFNVVGSLERVTNILERFEVVRNYP